MGDAGRGGRSDGVEESAGVPAVCVAIRAAIHGSGLTQDRVGELLGEKQQTVSGWTRRREPRLDDLRRIEAVLDRPLGTILRAAGYVSGDPVSPRQALVADPALGAQQRELVRTVYDAAVGQSSAGRHADGRPHREREAIDVVERGRTSWNV